MSCNALDGYQMLHKHDENVPLHEKCNNRKKQYMPVYDLCYFDILVYTSICQYMKYMPSYTCIYFDILLTSDLSEVSGFRVQMAGKRPRAGAGMREQGSGGVLRV